VLTFDHYLTPKSLDEAFDVLQRMPAARLLAGATDLLPWAREGRAGDVHLSAVVDLSRIPALGGISQEGARIRIGATTPISALQRHPLLMQQAPVLGACALWFADDQIREQATVGGNLVNASPAGDTQPALLALNTHVTLVRREGGRLIERSIPSNRY
jgi:xanthine dehydrogenase FAD-binding subunit